MRLQHLLVLTLALVSGWLPGQADVAPVNSAPNPYRTMGAWGTLPAGRTWGPASAVHVDRDGRSVWVAERCGGNDCSSSLLAPILKFDENGTLVASFGPGRYPGPHGDESHPRGIVRGPDVCPNSPGEKSTE